METVLSQFRDDGRCVRFYISLDKYQLRYLLRLPLNNQECQKMQFSSKQSPEERLAAMRKKAKATLKQRENGQLLQRTRTAELKALRLGREAEDGVSDNEDQ